MQALVNAPYSAPTCGIYFFAGVMAFGESGLSCTIAVVSFRILIDVQCRAGSLQRDAEQRHVLKGRSLAGHVKGGDEHIERLTRKSEHVESNTGPQLAAVEDSEQFKSKDSVEVPERIVQRSRVGFVKLASGLLPRRDRKVEYVGWDVL